MPPTPFLEEYVKNNAIHIYVCFFAQDGRWETGNSLKILEWGVGTISTIENFTLSTCISLFFLTISRPSQLDIIFPTREQKVATPWLHA